MPEDIKLFLLGMGLFAVVYAVLVTVFFFLGWDPYSATAVAMSLTALVTLVTALIASRIGRQ